MLRIHAPSVMHLRREVHHGFPAAMPFFRIQPSMQLEQAIDSSSDRQDGFTLIEITLVLVLLGVLAAVAVPKYFDLQEEAARKVCDHNKSVIQNSLFDRLAFDRLEGTDSSTPDALVTLVLADLGKAEEKASCPSGGDYTVAWESFEAVPAVKCSYHGDSGSMEPGKDAVTADNAGGLLNNLRNYYTDDITNAKGDGKKDFQNLDKFFSSYNSDAELQGKGENGHVDSEAAGKTFDTKGDNYGDYNSMTDAVKAALEKDGIDTSKVIWNLYRVGSCPDGNCSSEGYAGKLYLQIANKSDIQEDGSVKSKLYAADFSYKSNRDGGAFEGLGEFKEVEGKTTGKIERRWDQNKKDYLVLR